ncbi:hypothetical protein GJ744_002829 [Endocarpon pusillum]|uniref:Saccharopine dehydrogenase NADP binding domain-containing protein n=1 Tax=Endocarpon pusillum TaxID=364733 RepID=A0A8H7AAQ5_9EURO|nr:hypothetical protein GJ744_002829 [Endocarpon pusillum]
MASSRAYSLVLLGATGYTGKLCAEHITNHLPTNLKWAVAGRSTSKLQDIVTGLKRIDPDRSQPDILPVNLNQQELNDLAKKTRVVLNCIGPYHLYSTPVVAACAENGTHYLDVTGEIPWVREMLQKYHDKAKATGAILIPEIGVESAPSDLLAYTAVSTIRDSLNCGVRDVICSVHEMKGAGISGGSLATALSIMDQYSLSEFRTALKPFSLSSAPPSKRPSPRPPVSRLLGPFSYPGLGILTTSITAAPNVAIVHRSSGLMPELYGKNFQFNEYYRVSNYVFGILVHFAVILSFYLTAIKPFRSLARRFVYQPGQGPSAEATTKDVLEFRAIAVADDKTGGKDKRAMAKIRYEGGIYYFTGLLLAEGAMVLLEHEDLVKTLGGGLLTPACLGDKFIERLQKVNVRIEGEMLP